MKNRQMAVIVDNQGKQVYPPVSRFLATLRAKIVQLRRAVEDSGRDLITTWTESQAQGKVAMVRFVYRGKTVGYDSQAGYSILYVLLGAGGVILGLTIFVTRGIPIIVGMTSNTTAMTSAGMDSTQVQYWTWGLWVTIFIVVIGVVVLVVKKYGAHGGGGGGGGGGGRRRRR